MAHESFEDPGVAAVMNRHFVNIKVDREERPDIDQIYQTAHQMLTQRAGGWPLTMFLTPDGTPFFGGTYFPKEPRYGLPGFADLCERVAGLWRQARDEIARRTPRCARAARARCRARRAVRASSTPPRSHGAREALRATSTRATAASGGAEISAPDRPRAAACANGERADRARHAPHAHVPKAASTTSSAAASPLQRGCRWTIPHFEKMLYDNGPLLGLLADAWR